MRLMVPYMVQYILPYMAPKMVPEIIILPEGLLILGEGLLTNPEYFCLKIFKKRNQASVPNVGNTKDQARKVMQNAVVKK